MILLLLLVNCIVSVFPTFFYLLLVLQPGTFDVIVTARNDLYSTSWSTVVVIRRAPSGLTVYDAYEPIQPNTEKVRDKPSKPNIPKVKNRLSKHNKKR